MSWNKPTANDRTVRKTAKSSSLRFCGLIAGAVVAVAGLCVLVFLFGGTGNEAGVKVGDKSRALKSVKVEKTRERREDANAHTKREPVRSAPTDVPTVERKPALPRTRESVAPPVPLADLVERALPPRQLFKTATESYISMAIPESPEVGVPPIPISDDDDFSEDMKKAFSTPITADEHDDESSVRRKLAVLDAKEELRELAVKEHWTLQQYVNAVREKFLMDSEYLADCHETIERAYQDPEIDDNSYVAMRDKINETLRERGLPEIASYEEQAAQEESAGEVDSNAAAQNAPGEGAPAKQERNR